LSQKKWGVGASSESVAISRVIGISPIESGERGESESNSEKGLFGEHTGDYGSRKRSPIDENR
jgi:hypothetical protein